jgi:hypothetical protein
MKKLFLFLMTLFLISAAQACPNCAASNTEKDNVVIFLLAGFILLTYIPYYIIFRLAKKGQKRQYVK